MHVPKDKNNPSVINGTLPAEYRGWLGPQCPVGGCGSSNLGWNFEFSKKNNDQCKVLVPDLQIIGVFICWIAGSLHTIELFTHWIVSSLQIIGLFTHWIASDLQMTRYLTITTPIHHPLNTSFTPFNSHHHLHGTYPYCYNRKSCKQWSLCPLWLYQRW